MQVTFIQNAESIANFDLSDGERTVGSAEDNTIIVDDPSVSARHARLFQESGQIFVEDLGSENGTYVNGQQITAPTQLHEGDAVRFGDFDLRLSLPTLPEKAPAPSKAPFRELSRVPRIIKSRQAWWALGAGVIALFFSCVPVFGLLVGSIAIVCGLIAYKKIKSAPVPMRGRSAAIVALTLGYVAIAFHHLMLLSLISGTLVPSTPHFADEQQTQKETPHEEASRLLVESIRDFNSYLSRINSPSEVTVEALQKAIQIRILGEKCGQPHAAYQNLVWTEAETMLLHFARLQLQEQGLRAYPGYGGGQRSDLHGTYTDRSGSPAGSWYQGAGARQYINRSGNPADSTYKSFGGSQHQVDAQGNSVSVPNRYYRSDLPAQQGTYIDRNGSPAGSWYQGAGARQYINRSGNPADSTYKSFGGSQHHVDAQGNPAGSTRPFGTGKLDTDSTGNPAGSSYSFGDTKHYRDSNGNPAGSSYKLGNTTYHIDANGNPAGAAQGQ